MRGDVSAVSLLLAVCQSFGQHFHIGLVDVVGGVARRGRVGIQITVTRSNNSSGRDIRLMAPPTVRKIRRRSAPCRPDALQESRIWLAPEHPDRACGSCYLG